MAVRRLSCALACVVVAAGLGACAGASKPHTDTGDGAVGHDMTLADADADAGGAGDDGGGGPDDLATPHDGPADAAGGGDMTKSSCVPQTQPCDVVCQNCAPGYKCALGAMNMPACGLPGPVTAGNRCGTMNTGDDCVAGDVCIRESDTLMINKCHPFCRTDGDCTNGGRCVYKITGTSIMICSQTVNGCNPVAQTGCTGSGCFIVTPTGLTGCHEPGTGAQGASCTSDYECKGGYGCFYFGNPTPTTGKCYQLCTVGKAGACPSGLNCYTITNWSDNKTTGVCDTP